LRIKDFIQNVLFFLALIAAFILLRTFVFTPVVVSGHSMDPNLSNGERVIALKNQEIRRFSIVTLRIPDEHGDKINYVKRVIGLPGDTIQYMEDVLYVNGQPVHEPFLNEYKEHLPEQELFTNDFSLSHLTGVEQVPAGKYFVLGDNRPLSKDSRSFGFVDKNEIFGVVRFAFWPLNRFGPVSDIYESN